MKQSLISGGCFCGAVRYEAGGSPYNITHCHCPDCRRSSGAPFVTWASFRRSGVRFVRGAPRELSRAGRLRSFCPRCGTPLSFMSGTDADEIDVTVCSFDHPEIVTPVDHTWYEDRMPWICLADDLPKHKRKRERRADSLWKRMTDVRARTVPNRRPSRPENRRRQNRRLS